MERFKTVSGDDLKIEPSTSLQVEYVLQHFRDVWVVVDSYPYLAIDTNRLNDYVGKLGKFAVFSHAQLYQNMRSEEFGQRLISVLAGPGINAGFSSSGQVLVEGVANPKARGILYFNDPLYIGCHAFSASQIHYICVDSTDFFQRKFGDLVVIDNYSRPESNFADFNRLNDLVRFLHESYFNGPRDAQKDLIHLSKLLDEIFLENIKIHSAAMAHHEACSPGEKAVSYEAPLLTKYGRLTHDAAGQPRVEISFALLHYEKAIREFNELKKAAQDDARDLAFLHGVYCVVSVAACIEAIANKLVFIATLTHPNYRDRRQPLEKINDSATLLAKAQGRIFSPLIQGYSSYDALDRVRVERNAFMHAKEFDSDIDPKELTSTVAAAVGEDSCREYLKELRLAVGFVYDQLPDQVRPVVTQDKNRWMGDLEVP